MRKNYWITKDLAKDLTALAHAMYAESNPGVEVNNPKPLMEILGLKKPLSMQEKLDRLFMRPGGLIEQMYEQGEETPEDFDDFDIPDDDIEPISPYEYHDMQPEIPLSPLPSKSSNSAPAQNAEETGNHATEEQGESATE